VEAEDHEQGAALMATSPWLIINGRRVRRAKVVARNRALLGGGSPDPGGGGPGNGGDPDENGPPE
jgi:hypothetical protein